MAILLASFSVQAQEPKVHKKEKTKIEQFISKAAKAQKGFKEKSSNVNLITGFNIEYWAGEAWYPSTKSELVYDADMLVSLTTKVDDGIEWVISERKTNSYTNGLLTLELYEEYDIDTEQLYPESRTGYTYKTGTSPAIIESITYQYWTGNTWIIDGKDEFEVTNNMISGGTYYEWDGSSLVQEDKFIITQEDENTIITYLSWSGSTWLVSDRSIYMGVTIAEIYNASFNNSVLSEIPYFLLNDITFDYINQEWYNNEWVNYDRQVTVDTYDSESNSLLLKTINTDYWYDGSWETEDIFRVHYNGNVNPDSADLAYLIDDGEEVQWEFYYKDKYTYDNNGLYSEVIIMTNFGEGLGNFYKYDFFWNQTQTANEELEKGVHTFSLNPAYPNPFNPSTTISYSLEKASFVTIRVYDIMGRMVQTLEQGNKKEGEYQVRFDAQNLSSGQYIIRMESQGQIKSRLVTLIK